MLSRFYKSPEWEGLIKLLKIERVGVDGLLRCEHCGEPITRAYDCIAHHIQQLTPDNVDDYSISLNPDNIMLVHHKCHNAIHARFGCEGSRHVYLVYGSPCSGKTTMVQTSATPDDIILDVDSIWTAITNNARYVKPDRLKQPVFAVRDCLLDCIKTRRGKWVNAWIIGGYPLLMERRRLCDTMGAESVFVDTDRETCLMRAEERGGEWVRFVNEWWDRFQPDSPP